MHTTTTGTAGKLFVRTVKGKVRRIGSVTDADRNFRLAGSMLIHDRGKYIVWQNLKSGMTGKVVSNAGAAAPDGWVTEGYVSGRYSLTDQSAKGGSTSLGFPFDYPSAIQVITSDRNLVAYSLNAENGDTGQGELNVMSFDNPGVYKTRMTGVQIPDEEDFYCGSMNKRFVACLVTVGKGDLSHDVVRRVSLHKTHIVESAKGCPTYPIAMHRSVAWMTPRITSCTPNRLVVMNRHGKVVVTKHRYHPYLRTAALGGAVFVTPSQHKMVLLTSAGSQPTVLART
jgi:hypothetical protein